MSLSKELYLRSDSRNSHSFSDCVINEFQSKEFNYRRDSFGDRFCDDLCEVIVQYLSLEDKLSLQCVSKQFQRTVFERQYELYVHMNFTEGDKFYLKNKYFRNRRDNYFFFKNQSLDSFKALLKKCPNVTSIKLEDYSYYSDIINQVFPVIIENCNNLSEVIAMDYLNNSNFKEFHRKFGPK